MNFLTSKITNTQTILERSTNAQLCAAIRGYSRLDNDAAREIVTMAGAILWARHDGPGGEGYGVAAGSLPGS